MLNHVAVLHATRSLPMSQRWPMIFSTNVSNDAKSWAHFCRPNSTEKRHIVLLLQYHQVKHRRRLSPGFGGPKIAYPDIFPARFPLTFFRPKFLYFSKKIPDDLLSHYSCDQWNVRTWPVQLSKVRPSQGSGQNGGKLWTFMMIYSITKVLGHSSPPRFFL